MQSVDSGAALHSPLGRAPAHIQHAWGSLLPDILIIIIIILTHTGS